MNKQVHLTTALALATAILSIPTLAIAQPTGTIEDTASLLAKGAAVLVSAEVTCDPTTTFKSFSAQLTQRAGNQIVQGFGSTEAFICDGTPQTVELIVSASAGRPFRKGVAFARAMLFACQPFFCENVTIDEEVKIVKDE